MISLKYARLWHTVGIGLILIVVVGCLVPAGSVPQLGMNDKLEHMIAYCGLALCYGGLLEPRRYPYLGLALLALGGGIEIAQGLMGWGAMRTGMISTPMPWAPRSACRCAWRGSGIGRAGWNDG